MLFNEIDNFTEVYNNWTRTVFWDIVLWSDWSPRKLGDQIPTKAPLRYSFITYYIRILQHKCELTALSLFL